MINTTHEEKDMSWHHSGHTEPTLPPKEKAQNKRFETVLVEVIQPCFHDSSMPTFFSVFVFPFYFQDIKFVVNLNKEIKLLSSTY